MTSAPSRQPRKTALTGLTGRVTYGRRVRRHYGERLAGGEVVHVEAAPGVVIVVAAWMLDRAACAGMTLGVPRLSI